MKRLFKYFSALLVCSLFLLSARPGENADSRGSEQTVENQIESFLPIYVNIIQGNCAIPTCHDGSFEPNFSTPQSAYYTTVNHPVIKNSPGNSFKYRVFPTDPSQSLLFERITNCCYSDPQDKMPLLGLELNKSQIDSIASWILQGAPDWKGDYPYLDIK